MAFTTTIGGEFRLVQGTMCGRMILYVGTCACSKGKNGHVRKFNTCDGDTLPHIKLLPHMAGTISASMQKEW